MSRAIIPHTEDNRHLYPHGTNGQYLIDALKRGCRRQHKYGLNTTIRRKPLTWQYETKVSA